MIRLTNVGLKYDSGPDVLTDVTFHLRPGSFHFLHGESGAGKTSLLRLMFMSLHPSRGEIRMFNEDITAVKPQKRAQMRRRIGIVFQDFRLLQQKTVFENVAFALEVIGKRPDTINRVVPDVLEMVGLSGKANRLPGELSGGEQQRVAIARAFVNRPLVLLAVLMAVMALMPPMLQRVYGYDVLDTGVLLAPRGIGILVAMFISSRLINKLDPRYIIMTGLTIASISMWQMTRWSLVMDSTPIVVSGIFQGLGMGLCFMPVNSMAFSTLDSRYRTEGASILNLFRSLGGSVGISIVTAVLGMNVQTSHSDLSSHITSSSMSAVDPATADRFGVVGDTAMAMINAELNRQALMIAYLDDFKLIMYVLFCALPIIMMMRPPKTMSFTAPQNTADSIGH